MNKTFKKFIKRINIPYKLVFLNKKTLIEDYTFSLVLWKWIVSLVLFLFLMIISLVFFFKNAKPLISSDKQLITNVNELEKLERQLKNQSDYIHEIQRIMQGDSQKLVFDTLMSTEEEKLDTHIISSNVDTIQEKNTDKRKRINTNFSQQIMINNYITPVKGIVSSGYDVSNNHKAIDISAKRGEAILSIAKGKVIFADWTSNTGYVIIIQHPNSILSVYKHNAQVYKKVADFVNAGEVIASVGNTGELTTGPHLHFELWINGIAVDPEKYIRF